ncbi:MAG: fluoride efflux transporter CrcB [Acidimicrobiia bacterium]|nr:MAG: fluoride efflux transporter CrcB [Acidimicrobiia bacterium]
MTLLIIAVAGSVGALARYGVSGVAQRRTGSQMPIGTAVVNVVGAFVLGLVFGVGSSSSISIAVVGFTGGFTTFSTWMVETVRLGLLPTPTLRSMLNLVVVPTAGVMFAAFGYFLTG